jgi:biopolymer transport protein ExbD
MSERKIVLTLLALLLVAAPASAQGGGRVREPRALAPGRQQLETRLRQRLWSITKNRVGFTDQQMTRLAQTSRGFDQRRRQLAIEEREQRQLMRREILAGSAADQSQVATALDRVLQIQRERIDLQIQEQRAFAEFMTPVQRARYAALQEQLRRRAERLRGQRVGADSTLDADEPR